MDYSKLTDEELNVMVADRLGVTESWGGSEHVPRYCTDPAAWGWLMERERISLVAVTDPDGWVSPGAAFGVDEKTPGRTIAIAYLSSTEGGV